MYEYTIIRSEFVLTSFFNLISTYLSSTISFLISKKERVSESLRLRIPFCFHTQLFCFLCMHFFHSKLFLLRTPHNKEYKPDTGICRCCDCCCNHHNQPQHCTRHMSAQILGKSPLHQNSAYAYYEPDYIHRYYLYRFNCFFSCATRNCMNGSSSTAVFAPSGENTISHRSFFVYGLHSGSLLPSASSPFGSPVLMKFAQ